MNISISYLYLSSAVEKKKWNWRCYICRGTELCLLLFFFFFPGSKIKWTPVWVFQNSSQGCREYSRSGMGVSMCQATNTAGGGSKPPKVRHLLLNLCCGALQVPATISPWRRCYTGETKGCAFSLQPLPVGGRAASVHGGCSPVTACPDRRYSWACGRRQAQGFALGVRSPPRALPGRRSTTLCLCWVRFWLCFFDIFFYHWHYTNQYVR